MSLENQFDVVIVSCFHQGPWLAGELRKKNFKVLLVDLSSKLGSWTPEDIEGPFGFFKTDLLKQSYLEKMQQEEADHQVENGFTIWRKQGPFEFKSPLSQFYFQKSGMDPRIRNSFTKTQRPEKIPVNEALNNYDAFWMLSFSQQLASTRFMNLSQSYESTTGMPLQSSFYVRWPSRNSLDKSLQWLKNADIRCTKDTDIVDLSLGPGKSIQGLELKGELSGLVRCENAVWCLTSEETYFYNSLLGQEIFPKGSLETQWSWMRYRLKYDPIERFQVLPLHFASIENENLSMTHDNLILWQKTASNELIDAWVRLPSVQRFNKTYLTQIGEKIKNTLSQKMESPSVEVHSYPQEYYYTYHQMGPSRYPLYSFEDASEQKKNSPFKNLSLFSSETLTQYNHDLRQLDQQSILERLVKEREIKESKKRKELQK